MLTPVDNKKITDLINKVGAAQKEFATFNQEQTDKVFRAAAVAANKARVELAFAANKETKMGVAEDKVIKNHYATEYIYNKYRNMITTGVFEKDTGFGYQKVYAPVGIVGAVIPVTNPTSTAIFKILLALKTRNGIIISPHPYAKDCVKRTCEILLKAAVEAGAPKNIIMFLENGTLQDTQDLMTACDVIIATGGGAMVRAAYSSGTPAWGVGAGNCPAIIANSADLDMATSAILQSNTFDNGLICATENSVVVEEKVYDKTVKLFEEKGGYIVDKKADLDKIRNKMFKPGTKLLNPELVGKSPQQIGEITGIKVPKNTRLILCIGKDSSPKEPLSFEKLSTYVTLYKAKDFNEALKISEDLLTHGPGHTCSLFIDEICDSKKLDQWSERLNAGRMVVNSPASLGSVGDLYNFYMEPSMTLGCGSWGGNSTSENIQPKHLLNIKHVLARRENTLCMQLPGKIYYKYGCLPFALNELKIRGLKKAFIVTDKINSDRSIHKINQILTEMGIDVAFIDNIEKQITEKHIVKYVNVMKNYEPDVIIAVGGGTVMNIAKLMRLFYEQPQVKIEDLIISFSDISKRVVKFPEKLGAIKLVCIPTTSGSGAEVTPITLISNQETGYQYPVIDGSFIPDVAIVDSELTLTCAKETTASAGFIALSHFIEGYVSVLATSFTDAYCKQGVRKIFDYLLKSYKSGIKDVEAKKVMANMGTQGGIVFGSAFAGIANAMVNKISNKIGLTHGDAMAILLPHVMRYNAAIKLEGGKQSYFPQKKVADTLERYANLAEKAGIKGSSKEASVNNLIKKVQDLAKDMNMAISFKEHIAKNNIKITEKEFIAMAEEWANEAFGDQLTGGNPRYPLVTDLKKLYIDAYHGKVEKI